MAREGSALVSSDSLPSSAFAGARGVVTPWGRLPPPQDVPPQDVPPQDVAPEDAPPEDAVAEDHPRLRVDELVRQRPDVGGALQGGEGGTGGVDRGRLRAGQLPARGHGTVLAPARGGG